MERRIIEILNNRKTQVRGGPAAAAAGLAPPRTQVYEPYTQVYEP